jgi:hypothetical protein
LACIPIALQVVWLAYLAWLAWWRIICSGEDCYWASRLSREWVAIGLWILPFTVGGGAILYFMRMRARSGDNYQD